MTVVVGIDPSLTGTGIAILTYTDGIPNVDLHRIPSSGKQDAPWHVRAARFTRIRNATMSHVPRNTTLAVMEGPSFGSSGSGKHDQSWYWGKLYDAFTALKIPIAIVPPKTRCKWVCDDGNADKPTVRTAIRRIWPDVAIDTYDEADGLCFGTIGAQHLGLPVPYLVLERHKLALAKIAWPQLEPSGDTLASVPARTAEQTRMRSADQ